MTAALEGGEWSAARPGHFTHGKDPVPIVQEARWAPEPVWTGGKSRRHRDSIPDRPARSQSLYRLSYLAHGFTNITSRNTFKFPQCMSSLRSDKVLGAAYWNCIKSQITDGL